MVHQATDADADLERLRHANAIRVLKLPAAGDEVLVIRAEDYDRVLRSSGVDGATALADALPHCTGTSCSRSELLAELRPSADIRQREAWLKALQTAGWLVPARQAALAAGPDEAPGREDSDDADVWLWGMPGAGRLLYALARCRGALLALLHKQKFGRVLRMAAERAPALRKLLQREARLDLPFVLRDLVGQRLVKSTDTSAGQVLELTPAGWQSAHASKERGRKRRR